MEFMDVVKDRFSCRTFDEKEIDQAVVKEVLEAGRLAPTAKNLQEQHVYVLSSPDSLAKVDEVTPCRYQAPVVLMVAWDADNVFTYPGGKRTSGEEDAAIVATHMMLAAENFGLDSCWINFFDPDKAREVFGLPESEEVLMFLDLGYARAGTKPSANHDSRKPLEETVTWL